MRSVPRVVLAAVCVLSFGCYHATVETGASPSAETINKSFASGWIYGLVPPSTVSTSAKCANGPARVETQLSFVNQVVSLLTLGIYTPMQVTVTCAAATTTAARSDSSSAQ
jgi:Bor protein